MPTNKIRKLRTPRTNTVILDESIRNFLLTGEAERGTPAWSIRVSRLFDHGEIEAAWAQHRNALLPEFIRKNQCSRPWAFWYVEHPDRKDDEPEAAYLERLGLLTPAEIEHLKRNPSLLSWSEDD